MHLFSQFFYMEAKSGSSHIGIKRLTDISGEQQDTHILTTKGMKKFWNS